MSNVKEKSLQKHFEWQGKIETSVRVPVNTKEDLMVAYTPGVAEPCMAIHNDVSKSFELTRRWNTVPVITDGTAVLGLGDIGPEAGMPVMEGKCALFKAFGNVDAFPICIKSKDTEEIIRTIKLISGSFGGINLEDISAPRCFEIENRLKAELDIPVFHDDQHGTAIVTLAALINALKLANKKADKIKVKKLVFVCGFNNYLGIDADYDAVNAPMFIDNLEEIKEYCNDIVCFYSDDDPYVAYDAEKAFADTIACRQICLKGAGHINAERGYTEFKEILEVL